MNNVLKDIIEEIDQKLKCLSIDFRDNSWRKDIPSQAGWYIIKTNTPIALLKSVGPPQHKAHINIPRTIDSNANILRYGITIAQSNNEVYVVYNGETNNLKARAREHVHGHPKTYCLGLSSYQILSAYKWTFCYVTVSSCKVLPNMDKLLRLAVEQGWRARNGWPILCRR